MVAPELSQQFIGRTFRGADWGNSITLASASIHSTARWCRFQVDFVFVTGGPCLLDSPVGYIFQSFDHSAVVPAYSAQLYHNSSGRQWTSAVKFPGFKSFMFDSEMDSESEPQYGQQLRGKKNSQIGFQPSPSFPSFCHFYMKIIWKMRKFHKFQKHISHFRDSAFPTDRMTPVLLPHNHATVTMVMRPSLSKFTAQLHAHPAKSQAS